jgi:RNase P/RNase MRP subunit p29
MQEGRRNVSYNSQSTVINANENNSGNLLIVPKDLTTFTYSGDDGSNVYLIDKGDNIASNPQNNRNSVNYNK